MAIEVLKMSEVKTWEDGVIDTKIVELRKDLFRMRMQKSASGVEKPHLFKLARKNIARLLTLKREKKL